MFCFPLKVFLIDIIQILLNQNTLCDSCCLFHMGFRDLLLSRERSLHNRVPACLMRPRNYSYAEEEEISGDIFFSGPYSLFY